MAEMVWSAGKQNGRFYGGSLLIFLYYFLLWEKKWYMLPVIFISVLLWKQYLFCKRSWITSFQRKKRFQEFLESFQFFYQTHQTIEAALEELSEEYPDVRKLAVYRRLMGERVKKGEEVTEIHIRIFFLLLEFYSEYGKGDTFLKGIALIKECVEEEIILELRRKQVFSGGFFLVLGSLLLMKPIENWAEKNVPELAMYYHGIRGTITMLLCLGVIFLAARVLIWLCFEQTMRKGQMTGGMSRILENILVQRWLKRYIRLFQKHYKWLYTLIRYVGYVGDCQKFLFKQIGRVGICSGFFLLFSSSMGKAIGFWGIMILGLIFAWCSPYLELLLCWYQVGLIREQEILYLQTILLAAREVEEIGAEELNTWLIRAADYYAGVFLALAGRVEFVKETEILEQSGGKKDIFYHMLEGLCRGRDYGWKSVFSGIEGEQMFLKQQNYQRREKRLENEGSIGRVLIMIPAFFILISWLILPFISEGLQQLGYYAQGLA